MLAMERVEVTSLGRGEEPVKIVLSDESSFHSNPRFQNDRPIAQNLSVAQQNAHVAQMAHQRLESPYQDLQKSNVALSVQNELLAQQNAFLLQQCNTLQKSLHTMQMSNGPLPLASQLSSSPDGLAGMYARMDSTHRADPVLYASGPPGLSEPDLVTHAREKPSGGLRSMIGEKMKEMKAAKKRQQHKQQESSPPSGSTTAASVSSAGTTATSEDYQTEYVSVGAASFEDEQREKDSSGNMKSKIEEKLREMKAKKKQLEVSARSASKETPSALTAPATAQASDNCKPKEVVKVAQASPVAPRTTIVIKNVKIDCTRSDLISLLNSVGYEHTYDLVYLPMCFKTKKGFHYGFVNFLSPETALQFEKQLHGFAAPAYFGEQLCEITWSDCQGLEDTIAKYRNSPVMHPTVPEECKPLLFDNGKIVPFPEPTKAIPRPRRNRHRHEQ
jgi:hypothetical protein